MPSLKDIKLRIASIRTTQKTTRAMKMVSAAKLRKAQDTLMRLRPYANKLNELSGRLVASLEASTYSNDFTDSTRVVEKVLVVVVSSNRGLCGAFNSAICKTAQATIEGELSAYSNAGNVRVLAVGRKAYEYFNKRGYHALEDVKTLPNVLYLTKVRNIEPRQKAAAEAPKGGDHA